MPNSAPVAEALRGTATRLHEAHRTGKPVPSPTRDGTVTTLADAYRVQTELLQLRIAQGESVRGLRVALTSVAARRALDAAEPVLGHLTARMFLSGHRPLDAPGLIRPQIGAALAFVLGAPLSGPGVTTADAVRAVECVLPALDIADSRIEDGPASAPDLVADNAGGHTVILGTTPAAPSGTDLRLAGVVLHRDGEVAATGAGGMALGSPLEALVWAANTWQHTEFTLTAGSVVLVCGLTPPVPLDPGSTVTASLAGLGTVTAVRTR
ncbi:2-keto-4-pentenoate hydratase [Streptomyces coerulescens]|uniref:2-keto-4-pentenoate hydratase n=1 Tax=Streptomyces coerulescens TaxID=29304 RepID=A0ABW0CJH1_STRCD